MSAVLSNAIHNEVIAVDTIYNGIEALVWVGVHCQALLPNL